MAAAKALHRMHIPKDLHDSTLRQAWLLEEDVGVRKAIRRRPVSAAGVYRTLTEGTTLMRNGRSAIGGVRCRSARPCRPGR